ncbi:hypothetical protein Bca101_067896 [Brassica carinata]
MMINRAMTKIQPLTRKNQSLDGRYSRSGPRLLPLHPQQKIRTTTCESLNRQSVPPIESVTSTDSTQMEVDDAPARISRPIGKLNASDARNVLDAKRKETSLRQDELQWELWSSSHPDKAETTDLRAHLHSKSRSSRINAKPTIYVLTSTLSRPCELRD